MAISTKGISQVDLSSGIKSKNNLKSKAEEGAVDSFSSLINMSSGNFKDENGKISDNTLKSEKVENTSAADRTKADYESAKKQNEKITVDNKSNSDKDTIAKDGIKADKIQNNDSKISDKDTDVSETDDLNAVSGLNVTPDASVEEKIEDLAAELASLINQITEILKDMLGISDEEVEDTLSALDMNFTDLLNTENTNDFVLYSKGATEVDILIDEQLAALVGDITEDISEAIEAFETFDVAAFNTEGLESETVDLTLPVDEKNFVSIKEVFDRANEIVTASEENEVIVDVKEEDKAEGSVILENADNNISDEFKITAIFNQDNSSNKNTSSHEFDSSNESVISNLNNAVNNVIQDSVGETNGFTEGVSQADIIRQVVDEIKANITNEVSTLEMRLNPESLGRVQITVSSRNGVMQAQIVAETEAAKNAIEENIATLRETLNNQDLKVEDVEVTIASYGFFEGQEQSTQDENSGNQSNGRNIRVGSGNEISDDSSDDEQLENEMMRAQGNSVSYTA
ncbi:MAG: flagellar hook-length control protein FliK [Lachnospiraceae bacterium]|nr:flagellar hook-length control protein FliK [Lachnospiraceae bacterium]